MNLLLIKMKHFLFTIVFFIVCTSVKAEELHIEAVSSDSTINIPSFRFVPSNYMLQGAGGIGVVSVGFGWDYSKRQKWATDALVGFVPKYETEQVKFTLTLRQTYTPFQLTINGRFDYHPLRIGAYVSTTSGRQFWFSSPDKYPNNYYTFSTKVRLNVFVGQDIDYKINSTTSYFDRVKLYYDFHTSDLNLIARVQNSYLKNLRYISLAVGAKFYIRK